MRYERKYRIEALNADIVTQVIRMHPASFTVAYPDRQINNVYFDTPSLDGFKENAAGIPERKKYRLRWYGQQLDQLTKPTFEVKIKDRELGRKKNQKLTTGAWSDLKKILAPVPELKYKPLLPVMINTYRRSYFISQNGRFRATIDQNLKYAPFQWSSPVKSNFPSAVPAIILELKYDVKDDDRAKDIFDFLPFRLTKNSKYMEGVNMVLG